MSRSTVDWVRRSSQTVHTRKKTPSRSSPRRQTGSEAAGETHRWRCRGAPPSPCPRRGWSLAGWSPRWLQRGHKVEGRHTLELWSPCREHMHARTFDVGDVHVELRELLTRAIHTLVHRLQDLFGVLLHPSGRPVSCHVMSHHVMSPRFPNTPRPWPTLHLPFSWEALLNLHLVMAQELRRLGVKHLQGQKRVEQILNNHL